MFNAGISFNKFHDTRISILDTLILVLIKDIRMTLIVYRDRNEIVIVTKTYGKTGRLSELNGFIRLNTPSLRMISLSEKVAPEGVTDIQYSNCGITSFVIDGYRISFTIFPQYSDDLYEISILNKCHTDVITITLRDVFIPKK